MRHFTLVLRHPLFGLSVVQVGAFDSTRARIMATRSIGTGYTLVSLEERK